MDHPAQVEKHVRAVVHHPENFLAKRRSDRRDETSFDVNPESLLPFCYVPAHFRYPFYIYLTMQNM